MFDIFIILCFKIIIRLSDKVYFIVWENNLNYLIFYTLISTEITNRFAYFAIILASTTKFTATNFDVTLVL